VDPIGQQWDARTYVGIGPHPSDPRALAAAAEIIELIERRRLGSGAEHVGSTAVPYLVGKNFVDLQITADPEVVPLIADALLARGIDVQEITSATEARQHALTPWARVEATKVTYPGLPLT